mmetsp:Transcript_62182/g.112012  ORF Transcript_62182/g.112012 Transcript_62182/m.112012 type:complete len:191 (-) Transcript_62182:45-617(-)
MAGGPMSTNPESLCWIDRVGKEQRCAGKHLANTLGFKTDPKAHSAAIAMGALVADPWDNEFTSPLHGIHRMYSFPVQLPRIDSSSRLPTRDKDRGSLGAFEPATTSYRAMCRDQDQARFGLGSSASRLGSAASGGSQRTRRSVVSSRSLASLQDQVEMSVQQEVARLNLSGSTVSKKERLEGMLKRAKGQ